MTLVAFVENALSECWKILELHSGGAFYAVGFEYDYLVDSGFEHRGGDKEAFLRAYLPVSSEVEAVYCDEAFFEAVKVEEGVCGFAYGEAAAVEGSRLG